MSENDNRKVIALVPMKAHSERVLNKNIRVFGGRPLYHWILRTLSSSKYIQEIYINTDSEFITKEAPQNFSRVRIINRPERLRGDSISMNDIISYDLSHIEGEYFLQTHSTNPLLTTKTVDRAIETFFGLQEEYDSLFSVTQLKTRLYDKDGRPINHNPYELIRTQDLPPVYEENSNIYIFTKKSFRKRNSRIGERAYMFEMDALESIDIDEELDFKIAEIIFQMRNTNKVI